MPMDWGKFDKGVAGTHAIFGDMAALMLAQLEIIRKIEREERQLVRTTGAAGRAMKGVADNAHKVYQHVRDTTSMLLRWGKVGGLFGGLLGAGGLFGLEHLMGNASALRTSSMGIGVNPQALLAARVNFGQFFNDQGALGNIANLQGSLGGQVAFNTLGIPGAWGAGAAGGLASSMEAVHRLYNETPAGMRQMMPWWQRRSSSWPVDALALSGHVAH